MFLKYRAGLRSPGAQGCKQPASEPQTCCLLLQASPGRLRTPPGVPQAPGSPLAACGLRRKRAQAASSQLAAKAAKQPRAQASPAHRACAPQAWGGAQQCGSLHACLFATRVVSLRASGAYKFLKNHV